jgi:hypothetical protein
MGHRAQREPSTQPPPRWAAVQESIARLAGVALASFDADGRAIAAAGVPDICRLVASAPEGARRCAA